MYLSVLRYRTRASIDSKARTADNLHMKALARMQPGFVSFKTYHAEDGEVAAVSQWTSQTAVDSWSSNADHDALVKRGRSAYYEYYTLFSCFETSVFNFDRNNP